MIKTIPEYAYIETSPDRFDEKINWCMENLYHGGYYEPNWNGRFPYIEFEDEKEYLLFLLRWA